MTEDDERKRKRDDSSDNKPGGTGNGDNGDSGEVPAELSSAIEKLSRDNPESMTEIVAMMGSGPMTNPLHKKMTEGHITQVLELSAKHDEREYDLHKRNQVHEGEHARSNRRYAFAGFFIIVALTVYILHTFKDNSAVLFPIISGLGGLVSGALAGYGIGRSKG